MPVDNREYENLVVLICLISFLTKKKHIKNIKPRLSLAKVIMCAFDEIFLTKIPIAPMRIVESIAAV